MTQSIWQSFLPYHIFNMLMIPAVQAGGRRELRFDAIVLFADVSGFTPISEALGEVGLRGSEELTKILNGYFEPMIELIQSYGGIIGRFGGDAMTVLFRYDAQTCRDTTHRALRCALEMQSKMCDYMDIQTSVGTFGLTMKAGLAAGGVYTTTLGGMERLPGEGEHETLEKSPEEWPTGVNWGKMLHEHLPRMDYVIAGSPLNDSAEAEFLANRGDVVAHDSLFAGESNDVLDQELGVNNLKRLGEHFFLVRGMDWPVEKAPLEPLASPDVDAVMKIQMFLHPSITRRVAGGQIRFINEHRKVTVLFAGFQEYDYDQDPAVGEKLQRYFQYVFQIVDQYGGYLNKIDMGDKGSKYLILFGAPIAYEDNEVRALHCALELQKIPDAPPIKAGVHTGFAYCGQVGSDSRQEYTVMGDVVNIAVRLMEAADYGEVLVSGAVYDGDFDAFTWDDVHRLSVKGRRAQIHAYSLAGVRRRTGLSFQEIRYEIPMVGRQAELNKAIEISEQVLQGRGKIVGLVADAGMGKSRLAAEMVNHIMEAGFEIHGGECLSHGTATAYHVWQPLLRSFWHLDTTQPIDVMVSQLETAVRDVDPAYERLVPVLGAALNLDIPDNELTSEIIDPKFRKTSRETLIVESIRHRAAQKPLALVFEDCHWLDPLSNNLLAALGRMLTDLPVLLLVVFRPAENERIQPRVAHFGHYEEIRLSEFNNQETAQLINLKLRKVQADSSLDHFPDDLVARITDKAGGNPFFIDEIVNLIQDQDLNLNNLAALQDWELPDSLRSLIISRIDRLTEDVKITLKVASIIGRLFRASWLWGVYPQLGEPDRIRDHLDELSKLDITPLDKPEPELEYFFKHILTRDVAYESLAIATRTMLHGKVGDFFESIYEQYNFQLGYLAFHYGLSDLTDKKRIYFRKAAVEAQKAYANEVAIEFYQRLLPLLTPPEFKKIRLAILFEMASVWKLTGYWSEAETLLRQIITDLDQVRENWKSDWASWNTLPSEFDRGEEDLFFLRFSPAEAHARCRQEIGSLYYQKGAYVEALPWLEGARDAFEEMGSDTLAAAAINEIGVVYWYQGDYTNALACFAKARAIGQGHGDTKITYRAAGNMGAVYIHQEAYAQALEAYQAAEKLAEALRDRLSLSIIAGNIGTVLLELGDFAGALQSHIRNLKLAQEIGYRQGVGISVGNMGAVYLDQGEYDRALTCYSLNFKISQEIGDQYGVGFALWNIGRCYLARDRDDLAEQALQKAVAAGRELDVPYELCEYLLDLGKLQKKVGLFQLALDTVRAANEVAREAERPGIYFSARLMEIECAWKVGQLDQGVAILQLRKTIHEAQREPEQASAYDALVEVAPALDEDRRKATELYKRLYEKTSRAQYRIRYQHLTGLSLPAPPTLPALPEFVEHFQFDHTGWLKGVET